MSSLSSTPAQGPPVKSTLATDPDMSQLVAEFAGAMPQKAAELSRAWETNELESIQRLAHQLKGSSGGYGFASVGKAAATVENTLIRLGNGDAQATLERLRFEFNALLDLLKRVTV